MLELTSSVHLTFYKITGDLNGKCKITVIQLSLVDEKVLDLCPHLKPLLLREHLEKSNVLLKFEKSVLRNDYMPKNITKLDIELQQKNPNKG